LAAILSIATMVLAGCSIRSPSSLAGPHEMPVETVSHTTPGRVSIAASKPVDAYVMLGGRIKTCWFSPSDPLFPNHVYRADASPSGRYAQIVIHEARDLGRAGQGAFGVDFKEEEGRTVIIPQNRRMTPEQAAKMRYDIERWKRGETDCNKVMPQAAAQPTGSR
jgi:hypothetical protein